MGTKIEWADMTINPIVGCTKCSPGCDNCYAEKMGARLARMPATVERYSRVITEGLWNGNCQIDYECLLNLPKQPKRIFVGSMGDVFHVNVPSGAIESLFNYMAANHQHTFMLLTKRAERMHQVIKLFGAFKTWNQWPLPNVWLGVTAENQEMADKRIPILLSTPAAKRFVSIEPMLGPVNLRPHDDFSDRGHGPAYLSPSVNAEAWPGLDWVIVGGETGSGARPMDADWARQVRDQCAAAGVPFFFKQMTKKAAIPDGLMVREMPA